MRDLENSQIRALSVGGLLVSAAFWLPLALGVKPQRYTADSSPPAVISALLLATAAVLAWQVYRARRKADPPAPGPGLWRWAAIGLGYLAVDEIARIHENLALWIRRLAFADEETPLTSRLDDVIIAAYLLVMLVILWRARAELAPFRRALAPMVVGVALAVAMVGLDLFTNDRTVVDALIEDRAEATRLYHLLGVLEEKCKVLAELMFVAALAACRSIVRPFRAAQPAVMPEPAG